MTTDDRMASRSARIDLYATRIMMMISEDALGGTLGGFKATSFTELQSECDANEYMIHADVPFDPDDIEVMNFYVDVQDEVSRRLLARASNAG